MSDAEFTHDVFLSHSAKDKAVVRPLAKRLRQDVRSRCLPVIHPSAFILHPSLRAFGSDWAQMEAGTFRFRDPLNQERRFIPLRLDDAPLRCSKGRADFRISNSEIAAGSIGRCGHWHFRDGVSEIQPPAPCREIFPLLVALCHAQVENTHCAPVGGTVTSP